MKHCCCNCRPYCVHHLPSAGESLPVSHRANQPQRAALSSTHSSRYGCRQGLPATGDTAKTRIATAPGRGPVLDLPSSRWGLPSFWIYLSAWKLLGHATGHHWLSPSCMCSSALCEQESFDSYGQSSIFCHRNTVIGGMMSGKRQRSKDYSSPVPSISLGVWP